MEAGADGIDPQAVIDIVLGVAAPWYTGAEPTIVFVDERETTYAQAYLKALTSPALDAKALTSAVIAFAKVISTRNVLPGTYAAIDLTDLFRRILGRLDDPRISDQARAVAWREILVRADGRLRRHLLYATPTEDPMREVVASLLRPYLIDTFTCRQRPNDPGGEKRPAIDRGLVPHVMRPPRATVNPALVLEGRIEALREASSTGEDLGEAPTLEAILAKRPSTAEHYFVELDKAKRATWETPAADLAARVLAIEEEDKDELLMCATRRGHEREAGVGSGAARRAAPLLARAGEHPTLDRSRQPPPIPTRRPKELGGG
jgi:hypothetical protein